MIGPVLRLPIQLKRLRSFCRKNVNLSVFKFRPFRAFLVCITLGTETSEDQGHVAMLFDAFTLSR